MAYVSFIFLSLHFQGGDPAMRQSTRLSTQCLRRTNA